MKNYIDIVHGTITPTHDCSILRSHNLTSVIGYLEADSGQKAKISKAQLQVLCKGVANATRATIISWIADGLPATNPYTPGAFSAEHYRVEEVMDGHFSDSDYSFKILGSKLLRPQGMGSLAGPVHYVNSFCTFDLDVTKLLRSAAQFTDDPTKASDIVAGWSVLIFQDSSMASVTVTESLRIQYTLVDRPMRVPQLKNI